MSSNTNKQLHSQSMSNSQSSSGASKFRKSIASRHFSTGSNNETLVSDDNSSVHSDYSGATHRKRSSGISMLKKKLSSAAHSTYYHNPLHGTKNDALDGLESLPINRHSSEYNLSQDKYLSKNSGTNLSTISSAHESSIDLSQQSKDDLGHKENSSGYSLHSHPLTRTFSTPSFFSSKFKRSNDDSNLKNLDNLSPLNSNDLIPAYDDNSFIDSKGNKKKKSLNGNSISSEIITGLDKLSKQDLKSPGNGALASSNSAYTQSDDPADGNHHLITESDIRQPSNMPIPTTLHDPSSVWKAPESWDIFNVEGKQSPALEGSSDEFLTIGKKDDSSIFSSHVLQTAQPKEYFAKDSNGSTSSKSMSPFSEVHNKKEPDNASPQGFHQEHINIPLEDRVDSYDSENDDIILTKERLLKQNSSSPQLNNNIFKKEIISPLSLADKDKNTIAHHGFHKLNGPHVFADKESPLHSDSLVSLPDRAHFAVEPRKSLPDNSLEAPRGATPFVDDNANNKLLSDLGLQSYEMYYNDFSTFDMNKKYVIKIFNLETNTFSTLSCVLNATVADMLPILKKKFNCSPVGNFQMSLRIGKLSKVLHLKAKPVSIQLRLLLLSGYRKTHDPLTILGIEDLSFVFQFLFHPVLTSQLSKEKEEMILKRGDFVHADLRDMDLSRPPIIFYQKASEIESLDLSSNANSFLPLDFIESATSLTSIRMVNLRASKFPQNITSVTTLISLELSRNFIKSIPVSISSLTNLTILNLQCNRLSELPESFSSLQHLQLLDLSSNLFTVYPEVINHCLSLLQVDLSNNRIESLPESINNLTKLAKLNLAYNNLKIIPSMTKMTSLRTINLKENQIISFNASSKTLQYIYLHGNKISSFEDELPNLRTLELEKNPLTSVYFKEDFMNNLTTLTLSKANLTIVPSIIWKKFIKLKKLDLNENNLTQISEAIANLKYLKHFSCNRNKLEKIPQNIVNLKNLQVLDLYSNNITEIISGFGNLGLTTLNLSSNALNPWQNNLIQELNEDSLLVKSLTYLSLADNRLNNESSVWLKMFTKLQYLNLSYNFFNDLQVNKADYLEELYLSGNLLTSIPGEVISCMKKLKVLMVNSNKIHTLPAELSQLSNLSILDSSNNLLKYNISNYLYDYNWMENKDLRYLNFSGNKRFEIADSVINKKNYADMTNLNKLLVLSLMDVTLKTSKIPDEDFNLRLRTTESKVNNMAYGVADSLGLRSFVNYRDNSIQRFRGKIDECLIMLTDGKNEISNTCNKLPKVLRDIFPDILTRMLEKYGDNSEKSIKNALRHSFLQLNKELNSKVQGISSNSNPAYRGGNSYMHSVSAPASDDKLYFIDLTSGATLTVVYIKDNVVYTANIGDTMAILSRSIGDHILLTKKHSPKDPQEYVRIRIAGGYVNNDKVDGVSDVSRSVGFFHLLPHIHASPDIKVMNLTKTDEMLIIATNELWNHIDYETASDIARVNKQQPMHAAAQIRDFAIAYGCKDSICVVCVSLETSFDSLQEFSGQFNINRDALVNMRRSNKVFEDTALRRLEPEIPPPTGNISIVFTDIKNSTSLWESFPDAMRSAIKTHNNVMRRNLRFFGGYEVKTEGDAFMVAFPTPLAALNWCLTVQLKLLQASWPEQITTCSDGGLVTDDENTTLFLGLSVRMGIHWGKPVPEMDVVTQRMDYLGPVVNKASRVSSVADGGQITLSMDFVTEFKAILDMSKRYRSNEIGLKEAYGDEFVGEVLERQLQTLDDIGYTFYDLGETKMKGLETKEFITLVYPEQIKGRFSLIQSLSDDLLKSRETMFFLRNITLKLEDVVSYYNCDKSAYLGEQEPGKMFNFTSDIRAAIVKTGDEKDLVKFFDHLLTRLECLIVALNIRQKAYGHLERLDENLSLFEILDRITGVNSDCNSNLLLPKPSPQ